MCKFRILSLFIIGGTYIGVKSRFFLYMSIFVDFNSVGNIFCVCLCYVFV